MLSQGGGAPNMRVFTVSVVGAVLFLATAIMAAIAAGQSSWGMAPRDLGHIGAWEACGLAFIGRADCVRMEEDNVALIALNPSRWKRIQGMRALTIISTIWAGAGALIALLLAVRSKRPSPAAAGAPIMCGVVSCFAGILALVLFYTLAEDSFLGLGIKYGVTFRVAVAYTITAFIAQLPFCYLVQQSWETLLMQASSGGAGWVPPSGVFLTPTSRKAFIITTP
jgi:hypothetical protein